MRFIHYSNLWGVALAGIGAFAAIRFTIDLRQSPQTFGLLASAGGVLSFGASVAGAFFLDRISLRKLVATVSVLASLCSMLMGLSNSVYLSAAGFVLFGPLAYLQVAPNSMWVSRAAEQGSQGAAFSVQKVLSAAYAAGAMLLLGALEHWLGIRLILLLGGLAGVAVALLLLARLPEPPVRTGSPTRRSAAGGQASDSPPPQPHPC
jgi:sugar phosphate permease